jgi:hypothetical protein
MKSEIAGFVLGMTAITALLSPPAGAGPSAYRESLTRRSLASGFERASVTVLAAERGPGREVIARRLLAALDARMGRRLVAVGLKQSRPDRKILSYVGESASLEVFTDGTKFRFRGDMDNPKELERTRGVKRPADERLEALGRGFIGKALAEYVKVAPGESLTFLGTRFLRSGGADVEGRIKNKGDVQASIAIFSREIDGIPVVGPGSKVAVWFANDGEPVAFDVDWPSYRRTQATQQILSWDKLRARVQATAIAPTGSATSTVSRFECGYVDLGVTRRAGEVQAGCSISYESRDGAAATAGPVPKWAKIEFVPAGVHVLDDPHWPVAQFIAKNGEPRGRAAIYAGRGKDPGSLEER